MRKGQFAAGLLGLLMAVSLAGCEEAAQSGGGAGTSAFQVPEKAADAGKTEGAADSAGETEAAGGEEKAADAGNAGDSAADAAGAEGDTADAAGETGAADAGKAENGTRLLHLERENYSRYDYDPSLTEEHYQAVAEQMTELLYLAPEDAERYPELQKVLDELNQGHKNFDRSTIEGLMADSAEYYRAEKNLDFLFNAESRFELRRTDSEVLSFLEYSGMYSGGAHGMAGVTGRNLNPETGEDYRLSEIVKDLGKLPAAIDQAFREEQGEAADDILFSDSLEEYLKDHKEEDYCWTLEPEGVCFWFQQYEVAPYASGFVSAEVRFREFPELFTGVGQNAPAAFVKQDSYLRPLYFEGEDGSLHKVTVTTEEYESDYHKTVSIQVDDGEKGFLNDLWVYGYKTNLVRTEDGRQYVYLFCTSDNDYEILRVADINGSVPRDAGTMSGSGLSWRVLEESEYEPSKESETEPWFSEWSTGFHVVLLTDPAAFRLADRMELISTYSGEKHYHVGFDGMPVPEDQIYRKLGAEDNPFSWTVKVLKDFEAEEVDPETLEPKGTVTLKEGEEIALWGTDNSFQEYVLRKDGSIVLLEITRGEWPFLVNGIPYDELLDGLMFAG